MRCVALRAFIIEFAPQLRDTLCVSAPATVRENTISSLARQMRFGFATWFPPLAIQNNVLLAAYRNAAMLLQDTIFSRHRLKHICAYVKKSCCKKSQNCIPPPILHNLPANKVESKGESLTADFSKYASILVQFRSYYIKKKSKQTNFF
jgi:hypothetical protein